MQKVEYLTRHDFPEGFLFGSSSSAFQYEGAPDSRGESIWDTFLKKNYPELVEKEKVLDAICHYDRYKDDVKIMKEMGLDAYRFSISWPRVLPNGRRTDGRPNEGVNQSGIDFYNNLINELISNQIEPVVCLFHWDLPQALETEYLGFLNDKIVEDFYDYADLCFSTFGDRVKKWLTFDETWTFSLSGYLLGIIAPGRGTRSKALRSALQEYLPSTRFTARGAVCGKEPAKEPTEGDPYKEIYIVAHNQLLAHATAVKLYREKYQKSQNGQIGIIIVSFWAVPYTDHETDKEAATRAMDFMLGWLLNPLVFGDYPEIMRNYVGERLPKFGDNVDVKGSFDFIGLNYYTSNYAENIPPTRMKIVYNYDSMVRCYTEKNGEPIGEQGASPWICSYPEGLKRLLLYIAEKYNNPPVYITENGIDEKNDKNLSLWEAFYDYTRINYHHKHLSAIKDAITQGANVKGYFTWSLLDNLEGAQAFQTRFGMNYVSLTNYERFPKLSAGWFRFFLQK